MRRSIAGSTALRSADELQPKITEMPSSVKQPVGQAAVGLRVRFRIVGDDFDLAAEDAAGLVDFLDRQRGAEEMLGLGDSRQPGAGEQDADPPCVRDRCDTAGHRHTLHREAQKG